MSWDCPYLKRDGSCQLIGRECKPLTKGCVLQKSGMSAKMVPVAKKCMSDPGIAPTGPRPEETR